MRILIVESQLERGGSARVACQLANHWIAQGHAVRMIVVTGQTAFYCLDPGVEVLYLRSDGNSRSALSGLWNNLRRSLALRRAIVRFKPHIGISFNIQTNIRVLLATLGMRLPIIVCERTDPLKRDFGVWTALMKRFYRRAAAVQCMSNEAAAWFRTLGCRRTFVVANPVSVPPDELQTVTQPLRLAAVGRLHPVKGFKGLLESFAAIAPSRPEAELIILGEGRQRKELEDRARELGIADRVSMPGQVKDPFSVLRSSSLFVLSSENEGFPNALAEALACGVPAVAFDCAPAIRQIVDHGQNGLIVPPGDFAALTEAIDQLLREPERRLDMGSRAPSILQKFGPEAVFGQWDRFVREVVGDPSSFAGQL